MKPQLKIACEAVTPSWNELFMHAYAKRILNLSMFQPIFLLMVLLSAHCANGNFTLRLLVVPFFSKLGELLISSKNMPSLVLFTPLYLPEMDS